MLKTKISNCFKVLALIVVAITSTTLLFACGDSGKSEKELSAMFADALTATMNYDGSYSFSYSVKSEEKGEDTKEQVMKENYNAKKNEIYSVGYSANKVREVSMVKKSGDKYYLASEEYDYGTADTAEPTVDRDVEIVGADYAKGLSKDSVAKEMMTWIWREIMYYKLDKEYIVDSEKYSEVKNGYKYQIIFKKPTVYSKGAAMQAYEREATTISIAFTFNKNCITKVEAVFNETGNLIAGKGTGIEETSDFARNTLVCTFAQKYDDGEERDLTNFDLSTATNVNVYFDLGYAGDKDALGGTSGMKYGDPVELKQVTNADLGEGVQLVTPVKWYTDEECTKEFTSTTWPSYDGNLYVKVEPKQGYARLNVAYSYNGVTLAKYVEFKAVSSALTFTESGFETGVDVAEVKVNGVTQTGKSITLESGKIYNIEYVCKLQDKVTIAKASEEKMFQNIKASMANIFSGKTSYTANLVEDESKVTSYITETYDATAKKLVEVQEEQAKDSTKKEVKSKSQIEFTDSCNNYYSKNITTGKYSKVQNDIKDNYIVNTYVTSFVTFVLNCTDIEEFFKVISSALPSSGTEEIVKTVTSTKNSLKLTVTKGSASVVAEFKFDKKGRFVELKQVISGTEIDTTSTLTVAYSYKSALWDDVSGVIVK